MSIDEKEVPTRAEIQKLFSDNPDITSKTDRLELLLTFVQKNYPKCLTEKVRGDLAFAVIARDIDSYDDH